MAALPRASATPRREQAAAGVWKAARRWPPAWPLGRGRGLHLHGGVGLPKPRLLRGRVWRQGHLHLGRAWWLRGCWRIPRLLCQSAGAPCLQWSPWRAWPRPASRPAAPGRWRPSAPRAPRQWPRLRWPRVCSSPLARARRMGRPSCPGGAARRTPRWEAASSRSVLRSRRASCPPGGCRCPRRVPTKRRSSSAAAACS